MANRLQEFFYNCSDHLNVLMASRLREFRLMTYRSSRLSGCGPKCVILWRQCFCMAVTEEFSQVTELPRINTNLFQEYFLKYWIAIYIYTLIFQ